MPDWLVAHLQEGGQVKSEGMAESSLWVYSPIAHVVYRCDSRPRTAVGAMSDDKIRILVPSICAARIEA